MVIGRNLFEVATYLFIFYLSLASLDATTAGRKSQNRAAQVL
jgi:hypothetical protein